MNKSVLVDIDDTLSDTQVEMLKYANSKSLHQFVYEEMSREFREGKEPAWEQLVREYLLQPQLIGATRPYEDALEAIKKLFEAGYEIHIASARQEQLHQTTLDWLEQHGFIDYINQVHPRFSHTKSIQFKVEAAKASKAVAAFDDTYDVAEALAKEGLMVFLIDKPWNNNEPLLKGMVRASNFVSAVQEFLKY